MILEIFIFISRIICCHFSLTGARLDEKKNSTRRTLEFSASARTTDIRTRQVGIPKTRTKDF